MAKNKELTPCKRNIALITIVALLIYSGYNAYLVVNAYIKLSANVEEFKDTIDNWNSKVILDVSVSSNCPTGYEIGMKDRSWPGIQEGCYCGDVSESTLRTHNITCFPFCTSDCSAKARTMGCKDVDSKEPVVLSKWFNQGGSAQQLCLKRSETESWGNTASLTTAEGSCPSGYTQCGTVTENIFCTKEAKCPVSDIRIVTLSPAGVGCNGAADCFDVEGTPGAVTKMIQVSRSGVSSNAPLSQLTINENGMCKKKGQSNVTPGRSQFYLLNNKPKTCNTEGNSKWTITDSINEENLFTLNGLQSYIDSLDIYEQPKDNLEGYYPAGRDGSDFTWYMFSRGYIEWDMDCRGQLDSIVSKSDFITKLKTGQLALLVIGMMSTAVLGLILSFMEIQNLRGVDLVCIPGKGEDERKRIHKIKKIINYSFKLIQIPFQIWAITLTITTKDLFSELAGKQCSTTDIQANFDYLAKTLNSTFQSNVIAIGVLGGSIILDLILMCFDKKEDAKAADRNVTVFNNGPHNNSNLDSSNNALNNTFHNSTFPDGSPFAQNNNFAKPAPQNIVIQIQNPSQPQTTMQPMPGQYNQQFAQPQVIQQNPQVQMPQPFAQPQPLMQQQPQFGVQPQFVQPQQQFVQPQQQFVVQPQFAQPQVQFGQPQVQTGQPQMGVNPFQ